MLDCSHFRMFVDPCNICAILVRRELNFPAVLVPKKQRGRFAPVAPWDFAETKPLHTSVFPGEKVSGAEKWSTKKNREKTGISRSGSKAQKGEGVTPFGFDIRKIVSKTWGRKGEEKTDSFTCYFFSAMLVQHFFCA